MVESKPRKHPLANCEECPLYEVGRFVPSEGPEKATLAVVGEAPGGQEARIGRPFVGPSGRLLDEVLRHHKIERKEAFLTNVTLCRPPDNSTPPKSAIAACEPRMRKEIYSRGADKILALGGTAAQAIHGTTTNITALRVGPPKASPVYPGAKVVATWHPAYCLRNADAFPSLVSDVGKFGLTSKKWVPPDWKAFEDPEEALQVIAQVSDIVGKGDLVVDIETGVEKDVSFDHPAEYKILCVGIAYAKNKVVVIGEAACEDRRVMEAMATLFRQACTTYHNGKFDTQGLYPQVGDLPIGKDTMIMSYVLDERPGIHSLEYLGTELLGAPSWKGMIAPYVRGGKSYANIPRPILYKYNAFDDAVTWDLKDLLWDRMTEEQRELHDFLCRAAEQLKFLELNGITYNREKGDELNTIFSLRLDGIEETLDEWVGEDGKKYDNAKSTKWINPRSPKQVSTYLHDHGIRVKDTTEETLKNVRERLDPKSNTFGFVDTLLVHRRQQKLYSTYVKGIRRRVYRGRVYTTYMVHGSTSGRLTSRNPNLQNIVRDADIRRQFGIARPGNVLIQADYKQAEGRLVAWFAKDEYLRSKFADPDVDLFAELSSELYGSTWTKEDRIRTKAFFYGISYGRTAYSIGLEYKLTTEEAEKRYRDFMELIPATVAWQEATKKKVLAGEDLTTPFGRKRHFFLITDDNKKDVLNEALSYMPQSTASDICLSSLIRLRPMLRGLGFVRLTIHDALVVECDNAKRDEVSNMLRQVMVEEAHRVTQYVPFAVDLSYGETWGDL